MTYVPTKERFADIFTKGLPRPQFKNFNGKLDMINIYNPTSEGVWKSLRLKYA